VGANRGLSAPATASRYCQLGFEYSPATEDARAFVSDLLQFARTHQIDLIAAMTDWTSLPLSRYRDEFAGVSRLAVPAHDALELVSDKYQTIQLAAKLSIAAPETWLIRSVEDLSALPPLPYPVVVKDRSSARWTGDRAVFGSVSYAYDHDDLVRRVSQRLQTAGDVQVQKFVAGTGIGFSCMVVDGQVFLPFQWQRIREVDPRGSGSSARKSVPIDPKVAEPSCNLISAAGFEGIAMVEYKLDRDGHPVLMEINGRPWGSLQLPIASGVDYPLHLVRWYLEGVRPASDSAYRSGITCRRIVGELTHLEALRHGTPRGWPVPYPDFWLTLARVAVPWYPGVRYEELSISDPRPGWVGISHWFRTRLGRNSKSSSAAAKPAFKGLVHCHTTFSYDGTLSVGEFCSLLRREGFRFVGLTEHTRGFTPERYAELVQACREHSDDGFLAIPGLEFRCPDGTEIAGIGIDRWLEDKPPQEMVADIRHAGGLAIWVHPHKRSRWTGPFLDCDAVEILNGKIDGVLAPNFALLRDYDRERKQGRAFHAVFGLDFHNVRQARNVWIECEAEELNSRAILKSLREGRFVSRVAHGAMSSDGRVTRFDYLKMATLRAAFLMWAAVLRSAPASLRNSLLTVSRPIVRQLKRRD
jgi:predicted ATP-grasp superfamily ATP-dependent carboligase